MKSKSHKTKIAIKEICHFRGSPLTIHHVSYQSMFPTPAAVCYFSLFPKAEALASLPGKEKKEKPVPFNSISI